MKYLDGEEQRAVLKILEGLPDGHAARIAAGKGASTVQIAKMVDDVEVSEQLKRAFLDACFRLLSRDEFRKS